MTTVTHTTQDHPSVNLYTDVNQQDPMLPKPYPNSKKIQAGQAIRSIPRGAKKEITNFFSTLTPKLINSYISDWSSLIPTTKQNQINRWRFAYCTVHTPWERSCDQFNQIKNIYGYIPIDRLRHLLSQSTGGMHTVKATGLCHFQLLWDMEPTLFKPTNDWQQWRNNLIPRLPNIGQAKISFAIEMIHPLKAQCLCLDRHMLKAFGWTHMDINPSLRQYTHYENYWLHISNQYNVPPVISRNIFWDKIQNQSDSTYWTHVLR